MELLNVKSVDKSYGGVVANHDVSLTVPKGKIALKNVVAMAGSTIAEGTTPQPIIKNVSCIIEAGESLGMTGPSGSGKSTLARLMLGIIKPISGTIRVDGAELTTEVQRQFSPYFGYLPQDVELFDGTVAENIARFREGDPEQVIAAAQLSGAHEVILSLPEAYETRIGASGANLSGGQRQRIGLARAVYDHPSVVVLDEPTSNLDNEGRLALIATMKKLKEMGSTVILIAHQPSLFSEMDKVAFVAEGQIQKFGPAKEVIQELNPRKTVIKDKSAANGRPLKVKPQITVKQVSN